MKSIYLSLGSNIGNRFDYISSAIDKIKALKLDVVSVSKLYETSPQGYIEQSDFLNCCMLIKTDLEPEYLLELLQAVELELDRTRLIKWGPRTIDIDIIWVSDFECCTESLILPHPRAFERAFVVVPLMDLPIVDLRLKNALESALTLLMIRKLRSYPMGIKALDPTVKSHVKVQNITIGNGIPVIFAGPCAVESEEQIMLLALKLKDMVCIF
jgi:2-amino-4-hydroxy-6-hydroxymethyldihydropteridine diphosphokinase